MPIHVPLGNDQVSSGWLVLPSPVDFMIVPCSASTAVCKMASCRAKALFIFWGNSSQRQVLSSRSVNRNVIVPVGKYCDSILTFPQLSTDSSKHELTILLDRTISGPTFRTNFNKGVIFQASYRYEGAVTPTFSSVEC